MTAETSVATLWEQALESLRSEIDEESFTAWLEPVQPRCFDGGKLTLAVPSEFSRNWLISNYHERIAQCFSDKAATPVAIEYQIVAMDEGAPEPAAPSPPAAAPHPLTSSADAVQRGVPTTFTPLNPQNTFESFVVGESNRFAHAAAQAVADPQSSAYNPLFLYGGVGLGKTHLMHAIGAQMRAYGDHFNVLYISSEAFMNAFIEGIKRKELMQFRNCFRTVDLLLLDDVQFFAGAERSQTEFFHTFNALFDAGKKIVISSDDQPKELTELDERLRSRFEAGLIVDIQPPELETRVAILQCKAQDLNFQLSSEVAIYVAERIKTNIRKLEGALKKLKAYTEINGAAITIDAVRDLLGPLFTGEEPLKISIEKIQLVVCKFFDVSLHDLTGPNRSRKFTAPRQIACYLAREMTDDSYPEIARKFGGRDHTSILHAFRKVQQDIADDLNKQNLIKYLTKLIKEEPLNPH